VEDGILFSPSSVGIRTQVSELCAQPRYQVPQENAHDMLIWDCVLILIIFWEGSGTVQPPPPPHLIYPKPYILWVILLGTNLTSCGKYGVLEADMSSVAVDLNMTSISFSKFRLMQLPATNTLKYDHITVVLLRF